MIRNQLHIRRFNGIMPRSLRGVLLLGLAASQLWVPTQLPAHEIPISVVVQALVRPDADRLRLLVRVPMEAVAGQEVILPTLGIGYIDLERLEQLGGAARTVVTDYVRFFENGRDLGEGTVVAVRVSLPSDRSFDTFDRALAHVTGPPLPPETELYWRQAMFDVLVEYNITSQTSSFSIEPEWALLGQWTSTVLRLFQPDGSEHLIQYVGIPGRVHLNPHWYQAAQQFIGMGFRHILESLHHLLFLVLLVVPFRRLLPLIGIVTAFTVAFSVTLVASVFGAFPTSQWFYAFAEVLIALSLIYTAIENMTGGSTIQRRWTVAFVFGLAHGFAFSLFLRESLQFAGPHLSSALVAFNFGLVGGQVLILLCAVPIIEVLFAGDRRERVGVMVLSGLIAHASWHWLAESWFHLREHPFSWPQLDLLLVAQLLRWSALAIGFAGLLWALSHALSRLVSRGSTGGSQV